MPLRSEPPGELSTTTGSTAGTRVYRPSKLLLAPMWLVIAALLFLGLSMVTIGAGQPLPVSSVTIGAVMLLIALWLGAALATSRLTVTPAGLVSWNFLRRRSVGWAEIQSFSVIPGSSLFSWPSLAIQQDDGSMVTTCVASFAGKKPARVAEELTSLQRELAPAPPADRDRPA
jgi:hypothetical protein